MSDDERKRKLSPSKKAAPKKQSPLKKKRTRSPSPAPSSSEESENSSSESESSSSESESSSSDSESSSSDSDSDSSSSARRSRDTDRQVTTKRSRSKGDDQQKKQQAPAAKRPRKAAPVTSSKKAGAKPSTKRAKVVSLKDTKSAVRANVADMHTTGNSFAGLWRKQGIASGVAKKSAARPLQVLNQVSQMMIGEVRRLQAGKGALTQEVEMMATNGRILVSANEESSVAALQSINLKALVTSEAATLADRKKAASINADPFKRKVAKATLLAIGVANPDTVTKDPRVKEMAARRVSRSRADTVKDSDQNAAFQGIADTLRKAVNTGTTFVDGGPAEDAAAKLLSATHRSDIITVDAVMTGKKTRKPVTHAEQNLVLALIKSGYKGKAVIAGGKRPCAACWMTMQLAKRKGFNVEFNEHPGGYWESSTAHGIFEVANALGLDKDGLAKEFEAIKLASVGQYVTNVGRGKTTVVLTDMVNDVIKKTYSTDTPSESESDISDQDDDE